MCSVCMNLCVVWWMKSVDENIFCCLSSRNLVTMIKIESFFNFLMSGYGHVLVLFFLIEFGV